MDVLTSPSYWPIGSCQGSTVPPIFDSRFPCFPPPSTAVARGSSGHNDHGIWSVIPDRWKLGKPADAVDRPDWAPVQKCLQILTPSWRIPPPLAGLSLDCRLPPILPNHARPLLPPGFHCSACPPGPPCQVRLFNDCPDNECSLPLKYCSALNVPVFVLLFTFHPVLLNLS